MNDAQATKLLPRNTAALRKHQSPDSATGIAAGNPASTRLESAVGNCFPGLECDLRNLERRFFPFLVVDIYDRRIDIVDVALDDVESAATSGRLSAGARAVYREIYADVRRKRRRAWHIETIRGSFGPLGTQTIRVGALTAPSAGGNRRPVDGWTAIRLLTEGSKVVLHLRSPDGSVARRLQGLRARYLDDNGALAPMFRPGELTQSLCSPWTHDFRDCGCYYWASNHPDIALPPLPTSAAGGVEWTRPVPWERGKRNPNVLPSPADARDPEPVELRHYEINHRWQELNFVLDRREQTRPYTPARSAPEPPLSKDALIAELKYAAGIELAVIHEYLCAAYSLQRGTRVTGTLRDDVRAAHAEIMRVAINEMRHLRGVNEVLFVLQGPGNYEPALRVATRVPVGSLGRKRPVKFRAATPDVLDEFIGIEAPSQSVDGVYRIIKNALARERKYAALLRTIETIMAEGGDHFETFRFVREWLGRHDPSRYLRKPNLTVPPPDNREHRVLQGRYLNLLESLYRGYQKALPVGGAEINVARNAMLGKDGIDGAADAVADAGFLVSFAPLRDHPHFAPLEPP
jgi:hypothetical protein